MDFALGGDDRVAFEIDCQTYNRHAGDHHRDLFFRRDPEYATMTATTGRQIQIPFGIECQTLWPAKPITPGLDVAKRTYSINGFVTMNGWPRNIEIIVRPEREMIRGYACVEGG